MSRERLFPDRAMEQGGIPRVLALGGTEVVGRFPPGAFVIDRVVDEEEALRQGRAYRPDAVLVAPRHLGMIARLRAATGEAGIPVLVLLEADGDEAWEQAMDAGAEDALRTSQGPQEAVTRVRNAIALARARAAGFAENGDAESNFLALAANAPIAIFTKDAEGRYTLANPLAQHALGGDDAVLGQRDADLLPADEAEAIRKVDREIMASGEALRSEEVVAGKRFLSVKFPLRDAVGAITGVCGIALDITDRLEAEAEQRRHTLVLEAMNRVSGALVAEWDLEAIVQTVCDEGRNISGAAFGAFFYHTVAESGEAMMLYTLSGAPREAFEKFGMPRMTPVFAPTFKGEGSLRVGDITRDPRYGTMAPHHGMPAGHLPVRSYLAIPVVARSGTVLGGLFFGHPEPDVFTEEAEHILETVAAQAAVAIENANLAASVQRELVERRRSEEQLENQRDVLEQIVREASLADVLEALTSGVERLAERKVIATVMLVESDGKHLAYTAGASCPPDWRESIRRIPIGASIGSCGAAAFSGEPRITVDIATDPNWASYSGEALRNGLRACWSSPILSSDGSVLGTFLIYYPEPSEPSPTEKTLVEVVTRTATIAIERSKSESTLRASQERFRVLADNISQFAWMTDPSGCFPAAKGERARILLVEDHASTREALAVLLQRREYAVSTAGTLAEARLLASSRPFDLLLSDIGFPDGSGFSLMAELRDAYGLKGIALTGYGMEDDVARGRAAGFTAHLTKPIRVRQLEEALAVVLGAETHDGK